MKTDALPLPLVEAFPIRAERAPDLARDSGGYGVTPLGPNWERNDQPGPAAQTLVRFRAKGSDRPVNRLAQ